MCRASTDVTPQPMIIISISRSEETVTKLMVDKMVIS